MTMLGMIHQKTLSSILCTFVIWFVTNAEQLKETMDSKQVEPLDFHITGNSSQHCLTESLIMKCVCVCVCNHSWAI